MGSHHPFDSSSGQFEISGLDETEITLTFEADGYARRSLPSELFEHGDHELEVELFPERFVELVLEGLRPNQTLDLWVLDAENQSIPLPVGAEYLAGMIRIQDARHTIRGLPAQEVTIQLQGSSIGTIPSIRRTIDLTADRKVELKIVLQEPARKEVTAK